MPNSVCSRDFLFDRMASGATLKMLCMLGEQARGRLAIEVGCWMRSQDVILTVSRQMKIYGKPAYIGSENGAEPTATAVARWLRDQNIGPAFITPGGPWHNGYVEILHCKLRYECLRSFE
ncbi:MAG: IS3 family transposase ISBcen23 [Steroidobacteraceae bacterium]|nr:IS3 family transposase ISBcen23 [Steroidobacteraceae bacterium]